MWTQLIFVLPVKCIKLSYHDVVFRFQDSNRSVARIQLQLQIKDFLFQICNLLRRALFFAEKHHRFQKSRNSSFMGYPMPQIVFVVCRDTLRLAPPKAWLVPEPPLACRTFGGGSFLDLAQCNSTLLLSFCRDTLRLASPFGGPFWWCQSRLSHDAPSEAARFADPTNCGLCYVSSTVVRLLLASPNLSSTESN